MATAKIQTLGFKTAVHTPMGDVMDATSIIYTVYGLTQYIIKTEKCSLPELCGSSAAQPRCREAGRP